MSLSEDQRFDLAIAFAERVIGIGATPTKALMLAAAQYDLAPDVLLTEWCRRLIAKSAAAEAIEKARA